MAAPTVVKWTDTNAPVLSRTASSLINVLDFCILQRGWTKEFSGTDKAVYRAGTGERKYYRVLNDGSFYYNSTLYQYCHAKITAYDTMTDVATGAGQWAETYFTLSIAGTAVPRPWMCIFDEKTVLFFTIPHQTTGLTLATVCNQVMGFGETYPGLTGQTARNFLSGQLYNGAIYDPSTSSSALSCPGTYSNAANHRMHCNRSLDGTRTSVITGFIVNGGHPGVTHPTHYPFALETTTVLDYPYHSDLLYGRPLMDDGVVNSMGDYIPFIYYPCHKGTSFDNWGTYTSLSGVTFIAIKVIVSASAIHATASNYRGVILINITEDLA